MSSGWDLLPLHKHSSDSAGMQNVPVEDLIATSCNILAWDKLLDTRN